MASKVAFFFFLCENGHYLTFWENLWNCNIKNSINTVCILKIIILDLAYLFT